MAEDRKDPPAADKPTRSDAPPKPGEGAAPGSAIPNRDRRREPPTIDAKADEVKPETMKEAAAETITPAKATMPPPPAEKPSQAPKPDPARPATTKADPAMAAPAPPRRSAGIAAALLAGVAGAALALAGGYAVLTSKYYSAAQVNALLSSGSTKTASDINAALAAAQKRLTDDSGKQAQGLAASIDDLAKRIAASEAQTKKLAADIESLRAAAAKPAQTGPVIPPLDLAPIEAGLGDLEKRISEIEKSLSAPKTQVRASDPDVKPAEAPSTPAPAVPNTPPPALLADMSTLSERLRALETRPAPRVVDIASLQTRLQQLEQRIVPLTAKLGPLEAALSQNRDALGGQAKSLAPVRERADAAALAVVARSLADALATGAPYVGLLKAAQALGAEAETTKALEPFAEKGVPSGATLTAQFQPIAAAILEGESRPAANASLTEKLAASAGKLVRVRPAEDTMDETADALVARIGAALRAHKYADALALYGKLPQSARAPSKAWADSLRARIAADAASNAILTAALARLSRP